jgi:HPt (histidine-containing phosphotransfer) domain-containing protein
MIGCPIAVFQKPGAVHPELAMPLPLPINQIASPPLAPGGEPIDIDHLTRMTLGDRALERDVLTMFLRQTEELLAALAARPEERSALAHTLKGSARAIGAFDVAASAGALEMALRGGQDPSAALREVEGAVADARLSIARILERA